MNIKLENLKTKLAYIKENKCDGNCQSCDLFYLDGECELTILEAQIRNMENIPDEV